MNIKHVCHYLKWEITDNLSLRYFITFENRKDYESFYYIKSHEPKEYQKVSAPNIIKQLKQIHTDRTGSKYPTEIIGRYLPGSKIYHKVNFVNDVFIGCTKEN